MGTFFMDIQYEHAIETISNAIGVAETAVNDTRETHFSIGDWRIESMRIRLQTLAQLLDMRTTRKN